MKRLKIINISVGGFIALIIGMSFFATAQKLPQVQQVSVRAPSDIKIDGQLSEWNGQFQAFNPIDKLSYTISNDDENLYLTLVAPYKEACRKAVRGGIMFTVSKWTDKKRKDDPSKKSISFPAESIGLYPNFDEYTAYTDNTAKGKRKRDSLFKLINQKAAGLLKTIEANDKRVSIKSIPGLMVSIQFNKNMDLVYELSIPLKYLGLDINRIEPFSYNICLNGDTFEGQAMTRNSDHSAPSPIPPPGYVPPPRDVAFEPTDFWGEYTLAKK